MIKRLNIYFILIVLVFCGLFAAALPAQERQEIEITIDNIPTDIDNPDFQKGEDLRKQSRFREAIAEFQKVLKSDESDRVKAVTNYHIGICYTWIGKKDDAESVFQKIMKTYPDDNEVIAYTKYCLSWIDVQRGNLTTAIYRLQQMLDDNLYSDEEFCSKAQFQIGRIYLSFLHDYERADEAFRKVLEKYPDSKITDHPFLQGAKSRMNGK